MTWYIIKEMVPICTFHFRLTKLGGKEVIYFCFGIQALDTGCVAQPENQQTLGAAIKQTSIIQIYKMSKQFDLLFGGGECF